MHTEFSRDLAHILMIAVALLKLSMIKCQMSIMELLAHK